MSVVPALYSFSPTRPAAGPPFIPASAKNGLSVAIDGSGAIVLGQNIGQAGNPAILLSNREIPMAGFRIDFTIPANSNLIRFNNAALNPMLLQATVNAQWSNIIAQNLSAGAAATSFLGVYNNLGSNMSIVKTSSTYAGSFGFPVNTGILYSSSVGGLGTDAMAFVSEAGFYWSPNTTGSGGTTQVAMRMLTNGHLQLYPIGTGDITDKNVVLGVFGKVAASSYAGGAHRDGTSTYLVAFATATNNSTVSLQRADNTINGPVLAFYKSRGTDITVQTALVAGDLLGRMVWQGIDGGGTLRTSGEWRAFTPQVNAASLPTSLLAFTTNLAGVNAARFWISSEGQVAISQNGIAVAPAAGLQLDVQNGFVNVPGTSGNTYRWAAAIAAPGLTAAPVFTSFYGGNTNALGDPVEWLIVNVNGTDRKVPAYPV